MQVDRKIIEDVLKALEPFARETRYAPFNNDRADGLVVLGSTVSAPRLSELMMSDFRCAHEAAARLRAALAEGGE